VRYGLRQLLIAVVLVGSRSASFASETSVDPGAWVRHPTLAFSITAGEVAVAQFRACVAAGVCDASNVDTRCNYGRDGHEGYPVNCVTFDGAAQYCGFVGGRLCTETEWIAACSGPLGRAFPYGEAFDAGACNVRSNAARDANIGADTEPVASRSTCEGGLVGLYDMAGNVAEWVEACKGDYCKFRGAGYLSNDPIDLFSRCASVCSGNQKKLKSNVVGIRCCRDAHPVE
jgi:formylglycine-generating enzyme required for sulfatase activity